MAKVLGPIKGLDSLLSQFSSSSQYINGCIKIKQFKF